MIRLTANVLYSTLSLLKVVKEKNYDDYQQLCYLSLSSSIRAEDILALCIKCCWINVTENKKVILSSKMHDLLDLFKFGDLSPDVVRNLIYDYNNNKTIFNNKLNALNKIILNNIDVINPLFIKMAETYYKEI